VRKEHAPLEAGQVVNAIGVHFCCLRVLASQISPHMIEDHLVLSMLKALELARQQASATRPHGPCHVDAPDMCHAIHRSRRHVCCLQEPALPLHSVCGRGGGGGSESCLSQKFCGVPVVIRTLRKKMWWCGVVWYGSQ
jgi:hypothetical protein